MQTFSGVYINHVMTSKHSMISVDATLENMEIFLVTMVGKVLGRRGLLVRRVADGMGVRSSGSCVRCERAFLIDVPSRSEPAGSER